MRAILQKSIVVMVEGIGRGPCVIVAAGAFIGEYRLRSTGGLLPNGCKRSVCRWARLDPDARIVAAALPPNVDQQALER